VIESLPELRKGDEGSFVERLQHRLIAHQYPLIADSDFGTETDKQVRAFQANENLKTDGVVGGLTWAALEDKPEDYADWGWGPKERPDIVGAPQRPDFDPLIGNARRHAVFGSFKYDSAATPTNPEAVRFLDDWPDRNILTVHIPQLVLIPGIEHKGRIVGAGPQSGTVSCHRLIADQLKALWQKWDDEGLLDHIITWAGMWAPRFIRGSRVTLSNHCFATAFDINAPWNPLNREPAAAGKRGCVWPLVALAQSHGFYWGGHFSRADGMHFEAAVIQ
jgi:hypothetical protein